MVEVFLAECILVDSRYQENLEVLHTFIGNKSYTYLLNVESSKLVFLKTHSTEFGKIIITFANQDGKLLEVKDKVHLTLLINKQRRQVILWNQEQGNMSRDMDFYHLQKMYLTNMENNYWILE